MTKQGHTKRTIIISNELEREAIQYIRRVHDREGKKGIAKRKRLDYSKFAQAAIREYLDAHKDE